MVKIKKNLTIPNTGEDVEQLELTCIAGDCNMEQPLWKNVAAFYKFYKLNMYLPYDPAIRH